MPASCGTGNLLVHFARASCSCHRQHFLEAVMTVRRTHKGGFTLVEILIVVIILGILAAIVIPQFTSASQEARKKSLTSQLQTLRSQIELHKLQHLDALPTGLVAATTDWTQLINKTDQNGSTAVTTATVFGP